ncbi:MAG: 2-dehydro-3-deoxygluconokinase [Candidatus Azotimanducaceae bacterium]|jgi:2-dehydro-3-deoxygluconokinase
MVELSPTPTIEINKPEQTGRSYITSFAGDVTNFAVYLKRVQPFSSVQFLSATGDDALSDQMRIFFADEGIDQTLVASSQSKTVGLYMINTDQMGERTFSYWRTDSAAKQMFNLIDTTRLVNAVDKAGYFYFSGITLAILDQQSREMLFDLVEKIRKKGKTIIFDPNYRARLWDSKDNAIIQIERSYRLSNILLSSAEDEKALWNELSIEQTLTRLTNYKIDEIVLTNGPDLIYGVDHGRHFQVQPTKADKVVDTTSAGDAFNASYIAARHANTTMEEAILQASKLASLVIGHSGAIIPMLNMPVMVAAQRSDTP